MSKSEGKMAAEPEEIEKALEERRSFIRNSAKPKLFDPAEIDCGDTQYYNASYCGDIGIPELLNIILRALPDHRFDCFGWGYDETVGAIDFWWRHRHYVVYKTLHVYRLTCNKEGQISFEGDPEVWFLQRLIFLQVHRSGVQPYTAIQKHSQDSSRPTKPISTSSHPNTGTLLATRE